MPFLHAFTLLPTFEAYFFWWGGTIWTYIISRDELSGWTLFSRGTEFWPCRKMLPCLAGNSYLDFSLTVQAQNTAFNFFKYKNTLTFRACHSATATQQWHPPTSRAHHAAAAICYCFSQVPGVGWSQWWAAEVGRTQWKVLGVSGGL